MFLLICWRKKTNYISTNQKQTTLFLVSKLNHNKTVLYFFFFFENYTKCHEVFDELNHSFVLVWNGCWNGIRFSLKSTFWRKYNLLLWLQNNEVVYQLATRWEDNLLLKLNVFCRCKKKWVICTPPTNHLSHLQILQHHKINVNSGIFVVFRQVIYSGMLI